MGTVLTHIERFSFFDVLPDTTNTIAQHPSLTVEATYPFQHEACCFAAVEQFQQKRT